MAKLFDGPRFMNDVTNELLKTPIAKETLGEAAGHAANFDVKKVASTLDAGFKKTNGCRISKIISNITKALFLKKLL